MSLDQDISLARRQLRHWQKEAGRLAFAKCAKHGHVKGAQAWAGVWYCDCCGSQLREVDFQRVRPAAAITVNHGTGKARLLAVVAVDLDTEPQP